MPKSVAGIPLQPLTSPEGAPAPAPGTSRARPASAPPSRPARPAALERAASLDPRQGRAGADGLAEPSGKTGLSGEIANDFLRKAGLEMALRDGALVRTRYDDPGEMEAQSPPSPADLARIGKALMLAPETPAKIAVASVLVPAVNARLLEAVEADVPRGGVTESLKGMARTYCHVLGGRDLAIDDTIATVNTYLFDRIGGDRALRGSNIAATALTALMMLMPTVGKNLPVIAEAVREGRYRDAVVPALSVCAIAAMTLNPAMAAFGCDKESAISAATGNALMMTNLAEILQEGGDWTGLAREEVSPDTRPFTSLARSHGLIDKGVHLALDFLHEFAAQTGFFVLNVMNAAGSGEAKRNPAIFPLLAALLVPAAVETGRGEQPFAEFETGRSALADAIVTDRGATGIRGQAARQFLQQRIAATYDGGDYDALARPLLERTGASHIGRQFGANTLCDGEEMSFLKGLADRICQDPVTRAAARDALDRIYRFERFDPAEAVEGDRALGEILRAVQAERDRDRGFMRNERGVHADHVYRNVIAHAIRCAAFEELSR